MFKTLLNRAMLFTAITLAMLTLVSCKEAKKAKVPENVMVQVVNPTAQKTVLPTAAQKAPVQNQSVEVIELSEENSVVLDKAFDQESVSEVMRDIQKLSNVLPKGATIYLVLNTPGGSVDAGNSLISFIKALPQDVKTISIFSASMGFQTAQNLGERLVLPNSTVMSHRAKFGVQGEAPGEMFSQLKYIMSIIDGLDHIAAARMGMTFEAYRTLVADEYWSFGANAVAEKSADRLVLAKCSKELMAKTKKVEVGTMFGVFIVELSSCPLVPGIVSISNQANLTVEQKTFIRTMFENKKQFVKDFILTNKIEQFQK